MNKADITLKFQTFQEREDVKETMRLFTHVLAQMYEKQGLKMSHEKAGAHILEEFDIQVLDRDELQRENEEMRPRV